MYNLLLLENIKFIEFYYENQKL